MSDKLVIPVFDIWLILLSLSEDTALPVRHHLLHMKAEKVKGEKSCTIKMRHLISAACGEIRSYSH